MREGHRTLCLPCWTTAQPYINKPSTVHLPSVEVEQQYVLQTAITAESADRITDFSKYACRS